MEPNDRDYTNGEITVHWRPNLCIHATTCYRELISVFNPRNRPWVNMDGAPTEKIIEIILKCPTHALTYDWNDPGKFSEKPGSGAEIKYEEDKLKEFKNNPVEIRIMKDGPYVVEGDFTVLNKEGEEMKPMLMTSFCRCGQSDSMPYCDGTHRKINFSTSND